MIHSPHRVDWPIAVAVALALMAIFNANGREIGSYDSQPTKFAARELLLRHTLGLNHVVGAVPEYSERAAFVLAADGRYRSAYSPVPAVLAAAISLPFVRLGLLTLRSPDAPAMIAKISASLLSALAVALLYLAARQWLARRRALLLAAGLGLGTGIWSLVSQTMWQHETAIFGLAIAVVAFTSSRAELTTLAAVWTAIGLALAGLARPQLAPMIAVMLAGVGARAPRRAAPAAMTIVVSAGLGLMWLYWHWFNTPFGALTLAQDFNNSVHRTHGWIDWRFEGLAGLLVSPSRGLIVFSPVVLVAVAGFSDAFRATWISPLRWCGAAAVAQFLTYSGYAVWWAGHTYGPRYMLDVLPLLVPLAAAALSRLTFGPIRGTLCAVALAWSLVLAATGAFCYPQDEWNTSPVDVNREHTRLWDWSDPQFLRCWRAGASRQNFRLFAPQRAATVTDAGLKSR